MEQKILIRYGLIDGKPVKEESYFRKSSYKATKAEEGDNEEWQWIYSNNFFGEIKRNSPLPFHPYEIPIKKNITIIDAKEFNTKEKAKKDSMTLNQTKKLNKITAVIQAKKRLKEKLISIGVSSDDLITLGY